MFRRYYRSFLLIAGFSLFMSGYGCAQSTVLSKGFRAPLFTAKASLAGHEFDFSLKKALAKGPVVVYFYPSAYTGDCDLSCI